MADNININITLEEKQALQALTRLTKTTEQFGNKAQTASKKATTGFQTFAGVVAGNIATRALGALSSGIGSVVTQSLEFEKAVREINTILPNNARVTEAVSDSLRDLSSNYATSTTSQAKAFYQIISAGTTDAAAATRLLAAANQVALGGLADLKGSINVLTDIINVYGAENISAQEATDSLFTAVRLGKTTIEELSGSLGSTIPLAKELGVGLDTVNAAVATLTARGQTTSERVTQLNSLFTALIKNQGIAKRVLGDSADAFSLAALETKGLAGFLKDLVKATGGRKDVLQELLGRKEAVLAVLGLASDGTKKLSENIAEFDNKAGAAAKAATEIREALDFQLDQAIQNIKNLAGSLFDLLTPALKSATKAFNTLFDSADESKAKETATAIKFVKAEIATLTKQLTDIDSDGQSFFEKILGGSEEDARKQLDVFKAQLVSLEKTRDDIRDRQQGKTEEDLANLINNEQAKTQILTDEQLIRDEALSELDNANFNRAKKQQEDALKELQKFTNEEGKIRAGLTPLQQIEAEKQLNIVKKTEKAKVAIRTKSFKASSDLLNALAGLAALGGQKTFGVTKALALAAIPVNTAAAVMKAYADTGVVGAVAAGIVGVTQFAKVASSKPPSFQDGGMVGGTPPIGPGDNINANVRSGEVILNEAQQDNVAAGLTGRDVNVIVQIDGREIARTVRNQRELGFAV